MSWLFKLSGKPAERNVTEPLFTNDDATDAGYRNVRAVENEL